MTAAKIVDDRDTYTGMLFQTNGPAFYGSP